MSSIAAKTTEKTVRPRWLVPPIAAGLAIITVATFFGLHRCEFVDLDDYEYVINNSHVNKGLSWSMFACALTHACSCNWHPLTWLSHALDCQLYGLNPTGHHIVNLVFHTLSTLVLFLALRRMTGALWRSAFVAALFAVHPLHVESVAWVAERKDVLSGLFFMLTLYAYARYAEFCRPKTMDRGLRTVDSARTLRRSSALTLPRSDAPTLRRTWYALALTSFALGLMSKPMLVTLPFVLLLLDYWPLRRFQIGSEKPDIKSLVLEKVPFFALAGASCVVTVLAQQASRLALSSLPMADRLGNAALACFAYLRQTFWPEGLSPFYPYPKVVPTWDAAVAALFLFGVLVVLVALRKSWPFAIAGYLWFLGMLIPVIGIVQVGSQARADRYTYLPSIGIFVAVTWAAALLFSARHRFKLTLASCAVLAALAVTCHIQAQYWRNSRVLFQHSAEVMPDNFFALTELGMADLKSGNTDSAMTNLSRALQLEPGYPVANHHMGLALWQQGKAAAALPYLRVSEDVPELRASTRLVQALAYMNMGDLKQARAKLDLAAAEKPGAPDIEVVQARLLLREGKPAEAEKTYRQLLAQYPDHPQAQIEFANFLLSHNRPAEAEPLFAAAIHRQPENLGLRTSFATTLSMQGKFDQALQQLETARKLAPADSMLQFQSAEILTQSQKTREALGCYEKALELNPTFAAAMNNLAWILATHPADQIRNGRRAVELAEKACELTKWEMPTLLGTLAAAYAEAGRFDDAIKTAERARDKARSAHEDLIARRNDQLLDLYRLRKPYRERPDTAAAKGQN